MMSHQVCKINMALTGVSSPIVPVVQTCMKKSEKSLMMNNVDAYIADDNILIYYFIFTNFQGISQLRF